MKFFWQKVRKLRTWENLENMMITHNQLIVITLEEWFEELTNKNKLYYWIQKNVRLAFGEKIIKIDLPFRFSIYAIGTPNLRNKFMEVPDKT